MSILNKPVTVDSLMQDIVKLDTIVPVFRVCLCATDHTFGFTCWVVFRSLGQNLDHIETGGDTAIEALTKLRDGLLEKFMSREYYMEKAKE